MSDIEFREECFNRNSHWFRNRVFSQQLWKIENKIYLIVEDYNSEEGEYKDSFEAERSYNLKPMSKN